MLLLMVGDRGAEIEPVALSGQVCPTPRCSLLKQCSDIEQDKTHTWWVGLWLVGCQSEMSGGPERVYEPGCEPRASVPQGPCSQSQGTMDTVAGLVLSG